MKNKILIIVGVVATLLGTGMGLAVLNSYGSITGYATVEQAITIDVMGSSVDTNYSITARQGEIKFSPKIKLVNSATVPISVNINATTISGGTSSDVNLTVVDENQTVVLTNPVIVPTDDLYVYVKHEFDNAANIGNYVFSFSVSPS